MTDLIAELADIFLRDGEGATERELGAMAIIFLRTHHATLTRIIEYEAAIRAELEKVRKDAALLDFQARECITVRCEATDDDDVLYEAVDYYMAEPKERVIGTGETPREALSQAMHDSARDGSDG